MTMSGAAFFALLGIAPLLAALSGEGIEIGSIKLPSILASRRPIVAAVESMILTASLVLVVLRFHKVINGRHGPMARNIEIKAHIENVEALAPRAAALANEGPSEIVQDDTFFRCDSGRLKLRAFSSESGELIFYHRADQLGPKESFYLRLPTSAPETLRDLLSFAYGQVGRVRKHRTVFLIGRTRINLDRVEGLGHFLELEVMLADAEPSEGGVREAHELMEKLGVQPSQLIEGAYVDLQARQGV